jgi:hypothetical protein
MDCRAGGIVIVDEVRRDLNNCDCHYCTATM